MDGCLLTLAIKDDRKTIGEACGRSLLDVRTRTLQRALQNPCTSRRRGG